MGNLKIKGQQDIQGMVFNYDISGKCSLKAGGRVFAFAAVDNLEQLQHAYDFLRNIGLEVMVMGSGTNILFHQDFTNIGVLQLGRDFKHISNAKGLIKAGAAANLGKVIVEGAKIGYDLSPLSGIPGTIGGAIKGNSGNICSYVDSIRYFSGQGEVKCHKLKESDYGYRQFKAGQAEIILEAELAGSRGKPDKIMKNIREAIRKKKLAQPIGARSAGCFFKNPPGYAAGQLIQEAGLKGFRYGDAAVSGQHANFLINCGHASAEDIFVLSQIVKELIFLKYNINLEHEVRLVGF